MLKENYWGKKKLQKKQYTSWVGNKRRIKSSLVRRLRNDVPSFEKKILTAFATGNSKTVTNGDPLAVLHAWEGMAASPRWG